MSFHYFIMSLSFCHLSLFDHVNFSLYIKISSCFFLCDLFCILFIEEIYVIYCSNGNNSHLVSGVRSTCCENYNRMHTE